MELFGKNKKKQPANRRPAQGTQNSRRPAQSAQNVPNRQNAQRVQRNVPPKNTPAKNVRPAANGAAIKMAKPKKESFLYRFFTQEKFDFSFFLIVIILLAFGLVMLFSSTFASAKYRYGDSFYFLNRQIIFAGVGLIAMLAVSTVDYHLFMKKPIVVFSYLGSLGLMLLVRLIGQAAWGATRWIRIGEITIQPSEIVKFVIIMTLAYFLQYYHEALLTGWGFVYGVVLFLVPSGLVLLQPHLSATIIIVVISFSMLFIGGARWKHMGILFLLAGVGLLFVLYIFPLVGLDYVSNRLLSWENPEAAVQGETYQTYQSLITIGSGGIFGQGLGNSRQKYSFLPVTENDFIFSVIVEELGFVGAILVALLFIILMVRGFYIASKAPDRFGMLLCSGIVIQIGVQAFLNIAVTSNAIPNTGVSLPFISYGGTALMMQLGEMGVVLNISRKAALD